MCFRARERGDNKGRARFERGFSLLKNSSRVSRPILFSWFHNRGLNVSLFETQESRPDDGFPPRRSIAILLPKRKFRADFSIAAYAGESLMVVHQRALHRSDIFVSRLSRWNNPSEFLFSFPFRTLSSPSNKSKEESKGLEVDGGISRPSIIGDSGMRRLLGVYWNNTEKREGRNLRIFGFQILESSSLLHRFKKKKGKKHEDGKDLVNPSRF